MELIVATTNRGKFLEIERALKGLPVVLRFLGDLPDAPRVEEDRPTFEENALKKAREIAGWSGRPALADDSGLVVPALGGRPGIQSARFAGPNATDEDNRRRLLEKMKGIPKERRSATFVCVLCVANPEGRELIVEGRCDGVIAERPSGSLGFGYDPLFYLPDLGKTMAELPLEEKNQRSHRGRALGKLREILISFLS